MALIEPDIPWNAGNLGRTALAVGATLHLVCPLGFSVDDKQAKRAGLDYWAAVDLRIWPDVETFENEITSLGRPWFFSSEGKQDLWQVDLSPPCVLVLGSETRGLSRALRERWSERLVRIPMSVEGPVRSLNVSTAGAVVLYEALRQRATGTHVG